MQNIQSSYSCSFTSFHKKGFASTALCVLAVSVLAISLIGVCYDSSIFGAISTLPSEAYEMGIGLSAIILILNNFSIVRLKKNKPLLAKIPDGVKCLILDYCDLPTAQKACSLDDQFKEVTLKSDKNSIWEKFIDIYGPDFWRQFDLAAHGVTVDDVPPIDVSNQMKKICRIVASTSLGEGGRFIYLAIPKGLSTEKLIQLAHSRLEFGVRDHYTPTAYRPSIRPPHGESTTQPMIHCSANILVEDTYGILTTNRVISETISLLPLEQNDYARGQGFRKLKIIEALAFLLTQSNQSLIDRFNADTANLELDPRTSMHPRIHIICREAWIDYRSNQTIDKYPTIISSLIPRGTFSTGRLSLHVSEDLRSEKWWFNRPKQDIGVQPVWDLSL